MSNQNTAAPMVNAPKISTQNLAETNASNTSIKEQINKLQQILTVNDTATTFSKSVQLLFVLFKESMILLWLALCWGIVALSWGSKNAQQMGAKILGYWKVLQEFGQHPSKKDIAAKTVQSSFTKSQNALRNLVAGAKKQVGLQDNNN